MSVWAFDLDACLVDSTTASSLRPLARDALEALGSAGVRVVIWSAGGADYARRVAERVDIASLVDGFYDKVRDGDGRWTTAVFAPEHVPTTCVDDQPDSLPRDVLVIAVPPYIGASPHNTGFTAVQAAVMSLLATSKAAEIG